MSIKCVQYTIFPYTVPVDSREPSVNEIGTQGLVVRTKQPQNSSEVLLDMRYKVNKEFTQKGKK